jgi:hypothetical protein
VIQLCACKRTDPRYLQFRDRHYIPNSGCHGQQLHYLVLIDGRQYGVISGASAVFAVKARDEFFGLSSDRTTKATQLSSIINNVVYRLEDAPHGIASQVLALWRKRIAADWEELYEARVAGFETFIIEEDLPDGRRRSGVLYRADNWTLLGITAGNTKAHHARDGSGGLNAKHTRVAVVQKLLLARKVRGVPLASTYLPTWQNPTLSRAISQRRNQLLARDQSILSAIPLP